MIDTRHNGWANYPTWNIKLWIDNDAGSQEYWRDQAIDAAHYATDRATAVRDLAERLEHEHADTGDARPTLQGAHEDIITWALGQVDWREIAMSLVDEAIEDGGIEPEQTNEAIPAAEPIINTSARERAEINARHRALADQIADALASLEPAEGWRLHADDETPLRLSARDGQSLYLYMEVYGIGCNRVAIGGHYPRLSALTADAITVTMTKPPAQIARDIARRFLPAYRAACRASIEAHANAAASPEAQS